MNIKFTKDVTLECEDAGTTDVFDKSFKKGHVLREVVLDPLSKNFVNIQLPNGDLAIDVPTTSFQVVNCHMKLS